MRATPTTWVVTGSVQSRSTSSIASSPTPTTRCVESSWTLGLAHPAYQSSVVLYVRSPAASSAEASADCPAVSGPGGGLVPLGAFGAVPVNVRTSAPMPCMSAYRLPWQVKTRPSPPVLVLVAPSVQLPGIAADTCWRLSSASGLSGSGGGGGGVSFCCGPELPSKMPLDASAGRAPDASVTSEPETRTAATAVATPTAVCARRRAEPARITIEGRGQRTDSSAGASASSTPRIAVDGTSRCTAKCALAVCSSRSAVARVMPASRAMWSIGSEVRWVSRSTLRWVVDSFPSASSVARVSASMSFCRAHQRALLRRWARVQASGRT